jgi:hypothetical protein
MWKSAVIANEGHKWHSSNSRLIEGINSYAIRQLSLGGLEPSGSYLLSGLQKNSDGPFAILPVIPPMDLCVREHCLFTNRVES